MPEVLLENLPEDLPWGLGEVSVDVVETFLYLADSLGSPSNAGCASEEAPVLKPVPGSDEQTVAVLNQRQFQISCFECGIALYAR